MGAGKQEVAAFHAQVLQQLLEDGVLLPHEHEAIITRMRQQLSPAPVVQLFSQ
jgi:hypothetical protein